MKRLLVFLFCLFCVLAKAQDAISVSASGGQFSVVEYDWTSDGSGDATGQTSVVVPGVIFSMATIPSADAAPTDDYDIVVKQAFPDLSGSNVVLSSDLLSGAGADRDTANTELMTFWPTTVVNVSGKIRVEISNAGNTKSGKVQLFVYRTLTILHPPSGTIGIPINGSSAQVLQYTAPGQAKWITLSGDATIADGGVITVDALGALNLADPNDDRILFWDDSAGAFKHLTVGSNLSITGTTLSASLSGGGLTEDDIDTEAEIEAIFDDITDMFTNNDIDFIDADSMADADHGDVSWASGVASIDADSVALGTDTTGSYVASVTNGTGISGGDGGSEGAALTLSLSHLGIENLTDPNADRIGFWDDSAGAFVWLTVGNNLSISGTQIDASLSGGALTSDDIDTEAELEAIITDVTNLFTDNDTDFVDADSMADGDHGDFSYSSGVATLDADVVAAAEMADADHGDISWTSGVASVDVGAVLPSDLGQGGASANQVIAWSGAAWGASWINGGAINTGTVGAAQLATSSVETAEILNGTIINEDISASAAIARSKLALKTPIVLTAAGAIPTTTAGANDPALDANDHMAVEMPASTNVLWQFAVPSTDQGFDGSVETIRVYWYKGDTNAVTWTLSNKILGDSDLLNTAFTTGSSSASTAAEVGDVEITSITDTDILGSTGNALEYIQIRLSTNAYTGSSAYLLGVEMEY